MKPMLQILVIESSPEGARRIVLELEKEHDAGYEVVDTKPALEDALIRGTWKVVQKNMSGIDLEANSTRITLNEGPAIPGTGSTVAGKTFQSSGSDIGTMGGSLSHYFNNFITVINGYSTLALRSLNPGTPGYREIETMLLAGERAAEQIRSFQEVCTGFHGTLKISGGQRENEGVSSVRPSEVAGHSQTEATV